MYIIKSRQRWKAVDRVVEKQLESQGIANYTNKGGVPKPVLAENPLQAQARKVLDSLPPRIQQVFAPNTKDQAIRQAVEEIRKKYLSMGPEAVAKAGFGKGDPAKNVLFDPSRREGPTFVPEGQAPGPEPRLGRAMPLRDRTIPISDPEKLTLADVGKK